jgi:hypothetical protein
MTYSLSKKLVASLGAIATGSILTILTTSGAAHAGDQYCSDLLRKAGSSLHAQVNVQVQPQNPKYDLSLSQAELTSRSAGLIDLQRNSYVNGLTDAHMEDRSQYMVEKLKAPAGGTCVWPAKYDLSLRYKSMVVYIANEFKEGSCPYAATMRHELEHVRINNETLLKNRSIIESNMRSFIKNNFPIYVPEGHHPDKVAGNLLRDASSRFVDEVAKQRDWQHDDLDSPESYAYWQSLCYDWSGKR